MLMAVQLRIHSGEVTLTEDDYVNGTGSTYKYELRICCVATMKSEDRVVKTWMAVIHPSGQINVFKSLQSFPSHRCCRDILGIVGTHN